MRSLKIIYFAFLCTFSTQFSFAQLAISNVDEHGFVKPSYGDQSVEATKKAAYFYRHHKPLPAKYSGYIIELTHSKLPLRRDDQLFKYFGNVFYDKFSQEGFSYGIKLNFDNKKEMQRYLNEVILPNAPKAKIVKYKKGIRKT